MNAMLKHLPPSLKGIFNFCFLSMGTLFWCTPMYLFLVIKFLSPTPGCRALSDKILVWIGDKWIASNSLWIRLTHNTKYELPNFKNLKLDEWYFITCNHQSWSDILILQMIFLKKAPFIRFFIKKELLFIPVLGPAWWAYDYPIMSRYSKEKIAKNPHLKGKDLEATKKACQKFQHYPVTILNFLEGTRLSEQKHKKQQSPFKNLLKPRIGGFAYAICAMSGKIKHVLDVTIVYPEGVPTFWQFLCGQVPNVKVDLKLRDIPDTFLNWSDINEPQKRELFSLWVEGIWQEKDQKISELKITF